ncbi:MAG: Serine--tRNA ligase, mitochondrial [Thelocarpon superellum]|nr:MAG: Serine--tRNA ligase, mitochondrial [Thelocarpon superellum]
MDMLSRRASSFLSRTPSASSQKSKQSLPSAPSTPRIGSTRTLTPPPDPTPSDPGAIEGLLNFHLSQLDTISLRMQWLNEQMDRDNIVLVRLQRDIGRDREAKYMEDRVQALWECKRAFSRNVTWHRHESSRLSGLIKGKVATQIPTLEIQHRRVTFVQGLGGPARSMNGPQEGMDLGIQENHPHWHSQNAIDRNHGSQKDSPFRIVEIYDELQRIGKGARSMREENNALKRKLARPSPGETGFEGHQQRQEILEAARRLKLQIAEVEAEEQRLATEMEELAYALPNLTSPETPIGEQARVVAEINEHLDTIRTGAPSSKSHVEIGEYLDLFDWQAARTSSGYGWCFLINEAALLEQALVQYALSVTMRRGWRVVSPPSLVYSHIATACGFLPRDQHGEQQVYSLQPSPRSQHEYSLTGTAEISLAAMKAKCVLDEHDLPLKTVGVSRCYRAEAGARGTQTKGLYRLHEFTKVEMFAWTSPDLPLTPPPPAPTSPSAPIATSPPSTPSTSQAESTFDEMITIQTEILAALNLRCRVLEMPSYDLGGSAWRKVDIEAFFPSRRSINQGWGEVTSASICTDYQARRLDTRMLLRRSATSSPPTPLCPSPSISSSTSSHPLNGTGKPVWPYTLNGTALAVPRVLAAILENGWDEERKIVRVPPVLAPFMGGREVIGGD